MRTRQRSAGRGSGETGGDGVRVACARPGMRPGNAAGSGRRPSAPVRAQQQHIPNMGTGGAARSLAS